MGGEGFMAKLMALIGGSRGNEETGEVRPDNEATEAPWATSPGAAAPPGFHRMPDGSLMRDAVMQGQGGPAGAPQGAPGDDIGMQVQQLLKQREVAKRLMPSETWNR